MTFSMRHKTKSFSILGYDQKPWLTEGSMVEALRRDPTVRLHAQLAHALFIYEDAGQVALSKLWNSYLDAALRYSLPILCFTATWRANQIRLRAEGLLDRPVNQDNARFLKNLVDPFIKKNLEVKSGGLMGCIGDAYKPSEALTTEKASEVHAFQADKLAESGCDFLFGSTLPAVSEALGMARTMANTHKPYVLSFVVRPTGKVLDGSLLSDAIKRIDGETSTPPDFYMVNCVHPTIFDRAIGNDPGMKSVASRLLGFQGNTSALSPEELDGSAELRSEDPESFAAAMLSSRKSFGLRIISGCCGTDPRHIEAIAKCI
jgi:homocysteine S-methyltransferase